MPPCQHDYRLDSIDPAKHPGQPRTAYLICTTCEHRQARITTRTDDEINAELAALNGE